MKTVKEPKKNIALLWQRPKPIQTVYRPMKYLLTTEVEDGLLLYNIVTSEMVLLDDDEKRVFENSPGKYSPEMDELIARHYLVKDDFNESKSVIELRALIKKIEPSKRVSGFTILPTTECNARCYYCFESDYARCTMTEKIAKDVVDYISEKGRSQPVNISWFGGEPLVANKRISQICAGLNQKGIKFSSSMVSNAYLFDEELVQVAKNAWNLTDIQITLDGTERVYNESKAYIKPKENPYKRVLRNIGLLLDTGIAVNVRFNVTDRNGEDLSILIDELEKKFGGLNGFSCYSHAVYDGVGFEPLSYDDGTLAQVDKQTVALDTKLRKKGLLGSYARLPSLRVIHCMADNDSCRLIYPDGTIGRCENKSSLENVGDIYTDIINEEINRRYKQVQIFSDCESCYLFPNCINLTICPETGKCSDTMMNWKKDRYVMLMVDKYKKYKQVGITDPSVASDHSECDV